MFDEKFRQSLKAACKLFGGQKAVASAAHIKESNLSKWLKGGPTLSPENIVAVLQVMGLSESKPDTSRVHIWHVNKVHGIDFTPALKLYFPNGGEIGRTAWALKLPTTLADYDKSTLKNVMFIYMMKTGDVRAVLRHNLKYQNDFGTFLRSHLQTRADIKIMEHFQTWIAGEITPNKFDLVWDDTGLSPGAENVLSVIDQLEITYKEAIRRIREK